MLNLNDVINATALILGILLLFFVSYFAIEVVYEPNLKQDIQYIRELPSDELKAKEIANFVNQKTPWEMGIFSDKFPWLFFNKTPVITYYIEGGSCGLQAQLYQYIAEKTGLKSRLISNSSEDHAWVEVYIEGKWIPVDPFQKYYDDPQVYERNWKKNISKVYAFEDGEIGRAHV